MAPFLSPSEPPAPDRLLLEARSQHLCALAGRTTAALGRLLSRREMREHGEHLARLRPEFWTGSRPQQHLLVELASWTAQEGRRTALERYARDKRLPPASDEGVVLQGMLRSVLSFWQATGRHPKAGWQVRDLGGEVAAWVVDQRLEECLATGLSRYFVTRLFPSATDGFAMSCSTILPLPEEAARSIVERYADQAPGVPEELGSERYAQLSRQSLYATMIYAAVLPATL